jgi:hypothetical protein
MTEIDLAMVAPADTTVATKTANSCSICGWTSSPSKRGGTPVHVAVVLQDVVHDLGRCPHELGDDAGRKRGRP